MGKDEIEFFYHFSEHIFPDYNIITPMPLKRIPPRRGKEVFGDKW